MYLRYFPNVQYHFDFKPREQCEEYPVSCRTPCQDLLLS